MGGARSNLHFMTDMRCMNANKERLNFDPGTWKHVSNISRAANMPCILTAIIIVNGDILKKSNIIFKQVCKALKM
jgi:hypothetical protein